MNLYLLAVGERMPKWVDEGFAEYAKRLPAECALELVEIPAAKRLKNAPLDKLRQEEGRRLAAALPKGARVVALEVEGRPWSTPELAGHLERWMGEGRAVALLVGGPDGLDPALGARADDRWSLSRLTLPHPLVRVVIAEQVYRAWTVLKGHPYHK